MPKIRNVDQSGRLSVNDGWNDDEVSDPLLKQMGEEFDAADWDSLAEDEDGDIEPSGEHVAEQGDESDQS